MINIGEETEQIEFKKSTESLRKALYLLHPSLTNMALVYFILASKIMVML